MEDENFNDIISKKLKEFNRNKKRTELEIALDTVSEFILLLFDRLTEEQDDN